MVSTRAQILVIGMLSGIVAGGGVIALAQGNRPRTDSVSGIFNGSPVNAKQRVCGGQDGQYLEIRGQFSGAITSSDPRLTGNLDFMAEPALVNLTTGFGTFRGRFRVVDPATGMQKAQGEFFTVVTDGGLNHGFALGHLMNAAAGPAADFFARFESSLDASLNVRGQFGGTGDVRTPAVVQSGQCSGPFTPVP
jgi:hypothetical protein